MQKIIASNKVTDFVPFCNLGLGAKKASILRAIGSGAAIGLAVLALSGCQGLNNGLAQVNSALSSVNRPVAPTNNRSISNVWHVSDSQGLKWLEQSDLDWSDHGKLNKVDWFKFWSQQIHAKTQLADKAQKYCMANSWSQYTPGKNCEVFDDAYSSTKAQEGMQWANNYGANK